MSQKPPCSSYVMMIAVLFQSGRADARRGIQGPDAPQRRAHRAVMHNGAYATLEQVIDFYNRGGGRGIGADVPGQTLTAQPLGLTPREERDLVAFLRSLTDTVTTRSP